MIIIINIIVIIIIIIIIIIIMIWLLLFLTFIGRLRQCQVNLEPAVALLRLFCFFVFEYTGVPTGS